MIKFILIANYAPDGQESMKRYTINLQQNLLMAGAAAEVWYPKVFFGAFSKSTISGVGKWLGYIDKWLLFPIIIKLRLLFQSKYSNQQLFFHVCDHSNSPYLKSLPSNRSGITCHDVLAIRGALGYEDAYCPASSMGKILQKWILNNLKKAKILTTVSALTMSQLMDLCKNDMPLGRKWKVIHNSFNADFWPMDKVERGQLVKENGIPEDVPFILHVGSSLARKNRKMLLSMTAVLGSKWDGLICFVGEPLDEELILEGERLGLSKRIVSIVRPDHNTLVALYSSCSAFVFPSFSEGFGWPLIEAQACGAPVLASNVEPMPEVSGDTAIHADPNDPVGFADGFLTLLDPVKRNDLIQSGYENAKRFNPATLSKEFIKLYIN